MNRMEQARAGEALATRLSSELPIGININWTARGAWVRADATAPDTGEAIAAALFVPWRWMDQRADALTQAIQAVNDDVAHTALRNA